MYTSSLLVVKRIRRSVLWLMRKRAHKWFWRSGVRSRRVHLQFVHIIRHCARGHVLFRHSRRVVAIFLLPILLLKMSSFTRCHGNKREIGHGILGPRSGFTETVGGCWWRGSWNATGGDACFRTRSFDSNNGRGLTRAGQSLDVDFMIMYTYTCWIGCLFLC